MSLVTFSLVRHAESEANICQENKIGGRNLGTKLTQKGEWQAEALGYHFKKSGVVFTEAYSSTAFRTQKTAEICFKAMESNLPVTTDEQLLELSPGGWEGLSREIYKRADVRRALDTDNWNFVPGDDIPGESQRMVAERMKLWIEKKVVECGDGHHHIIVFTHGLAIKLFLAEILDADRSTAYSDIINPINNTSVTELYYRNKQLVLPLTKRNDTSHLQ